MMVIGSDVAEFLGKPGDAAVIELAEVHLPIVTAMVRAYVQGNGFTGVLDDPSESLAAVIVTSTARYVTNPSSTITETAGPFSVRQGVFNGWTLPELAILHSYRRRAA